MKAKQIELQYTINTGNYENVRIAGTFELGKNDNIEQAFVEARKQLLASYKAMLEDKKKPATVASNAVDGLKNMLK